MAYQIPPEYDLYLDRLISDAHEGDLPDNLKEEMKRDLYGRLENFLFTSFIQAMPNDAADKFDELMNNTPDQTDVQKFLRENIENIDSVSAGALLEFKDVYLGATKK